MTLKRYTGVGCLELAIYFERSWSLHVNLIFMKLLISMSLKLLERMVSIYQFTMIRNFKCMTEGVYKVYSYEISHFHVSQLRGTKLGLTDF